MHWLGAFFFGLDLFTLDRLNGVADQVREHPRQLRLWPQNGCFVQAHVANLDVFVIVEQPYFFFQKLVQVNLHMVFGVQFCERRKFISCVGQ